MPNKSIIEVGGKQLKLSNLDKIFYPSTAFTKGQVIDYYIRIAPVLLPHLKGRPLTLKRYPNGALQKFFYQKECPSSKPDWLQTAPIWSESNQKNTNFCLVEDLPSLIWSANLAALELHTSLSLAQTILQPTMVVFDLDPGPPAAILQCARVSLWLRQLLSAHSLQAFPKTSGSKGLQVYLPLNTPADYDQTKTFARKIALLLEQSYPEYVVSNMRKSLRTGKVFVDWSQNDDHKTTVCVYSLRARELPTVSTPVSWQEVEAALAKRDPDLLVFNAQQVLERVAADGDLFAPVLTVRQKLPKPETLAAIAKNVH
ncbi:ATP-dependent DNA ligase|uniref:Bifunctional non-homologous end joining protein LigD n=1 Tax=Dendrosporobacter quercicolus TaxID=146817 RepID=A0A1G9ZCY1_9FIRM|nr:non-homologous end-joining DNA ligase [Dendrosporobacter quercicolus]NSL49773.1 ATP-dependent DNA ligase [Dendrosporobacter quercicolus DSM 1736]SDN18957.1 bifunctional non-homologous end joining protein LigD [Dendrosporobacter quercicolus]